MKSGANSKGRRRFLKQITLFWLGSSFWAACQKTARRVLSRFSGAPVTLGHRLLTQDFPAVTHEERVKILLIGGGIAGLSACRALVKKGETDLLLLEMDQRLGGNSASSENAYTAYPLGAHYLPLPNLHDTALIEFLCEENIITGFEASGEPIFEETYLAAAPQSRLFIRDHWQEGLVPTYGVSSENQAQIQAFFQKMEAFKDMRGQDGKYIFDLPICHASKDKTYQYLDQMTMAQWLQQAKFTAPELLEHVQYCCLDDFGVGIERVSAWAGIHYFAARKSLQDNVLTWPEGNGFLVKRLEQYAKKYTRKQHLVYQIQLEPVSVAVNVYDAAQNRSILIRAEKVILACPQFVNQRLLPARPLDLTAFHYAPWLVATLVLRELPSNSGMPICWDNVIFKGKGLGYINTLHQSVAQRHAKFVLTYYCALDGPDLLALRRALYQKDAAHWQQFILDDLRQAHPNIESVLESMDIQRWGHGMISPVPGFIFGAALAQARQDLEGRIFFAHSDLSGMSLFEEAFHQGLTAAAACLGRD
jgi:hypothetical protein